MSPLILSSLSVPGPGAPPVGTTFAHFDADAWAPGTYGGAEVGAIYQPNIFGTGFGLEFGKITNGIVRHPEIVDCAAEGISTYNGSYTHALKLGTVAAIAANSIRNNLDVRFQNIPGLGMDNPGAALPGGLFDAFSVYVPQITSDRLNEPYTGLPDDVSKQFKLRINRRGGNGYPRDIVTEVGRSGPNANGNIYHGTDGTWRIGQAGCPRGINKGPVEGGPDWDGTAWTTNSNDRWVRLIYWNRTYPDASQFYGTASDQRIWHVPSFGAAPILVFEWLGAPGWNNVTSYDDAPNADGAPDAARMGGGFAADVYGNKTGIRYGCAVIDNGDGADNPLDAWVYITDVKLGDTLESVL